MHKSRNLSARRVLVNDIALSGFHQPRLVARHCLECCVAVTALYRFFDRSYRTTHLGAARFIDDGAAGNLARRLLGGSRIGHVLKCPSAVTDRGWAKGLPTICLIDADCFRVPRRECLAGNSCSGSNAQKNSGGGIAPAANWGDL